MNDPNAVPRETTMRLEIDRALAACQDCPDCQARWENAVAAFQAIGMKWEDEELEKALVERQNERDAS